MTIRSSLIAFTVNHRPWTIVIFLPNAQRRTIAQFCNRQDADDYLRAIQRYVPNQHFEVAFEPPNNEPT
jgi:hypothetical protein